MARIFSLMTSNFSLMRGIKISYKNIVIRLRDTVTLIYAATRISIAMKNFIWKYVIHNYYISSNKIEKLMTKYRTLFDI